MITVKLQVNFTCKLYHFLKGVFMAKIGYIRVSSQDQREYKIFCVNEKIHTKKDVPSVE